MLNLVDGSLLFNVFLLIIALYCLPLLPFHTNLNTHLMEKFLVNPNMPYAFSPEVMHKVVLNGIDFDLSEHVWDVIDDAFSYYWNIEIGFGASPDLISAVNSINGALLENNIIFPLDRILKIVEVMFDWIEQIPGVLLDDDFIVIPHSFDEAEEHCPMIKNWISPKDQNLSNVVFNDSMTDFVYLSDKLEEFYPGTYRRLTSLFQEMGIEYGIVCGTKDIWLRDYMPIVISDDEDVLYTYAPDYLQRQIEFITDIKSDLVHWKHMKDFEHRDVQIKLDGGNVVPCQDSFILTDKIFAENGVDKGDEHFLRMLKQKLNADVVIIPWHCNNPEDPDADVYGHADGLVRWTGGNQLLMSNHRDFAPEEADEIKRRLEAKGWNVTEMLFDVPEPNMEFNWAYINYLEVGDIIIVPVFGIPEDSQALNYIKGANPFSTVVPFRMRTIVSKGGGLHCITWNIKKPI